MPTGLIRRGAAYSLRRRVPKELIGAYGRAEIVRALGTKDRAEAKRLHALAWVALDEEFAAARGRKARDPNAHILEKLRQIREVWQQRPPQVQTISDEELEYALSKFRQDSEDEFMEGFEYDRREPIREQLLSVMRVRNEDALSEREKALRDIIRDYQTEAEALARLVASAETKLAGADNSAGFLPVKPTPQTSSARNSLAEVVKMWGRERAPAPKTVRAHAAVAKWFSERTGVLNVDQVRRAHVLQFKDLMLAEGTSPENIKTKLSRLRTILGFAVAAELIVVNPAAGVQAPKSKKGKPRSSWSADDLNKLFSGPVHRLGERPVRGRGEAAYWMPLLALFTGARREELAQLRARDIREVPYRTADGGDAATWTINIDYGEEGENQLKTDASQRIVPIHPSLIALGFLKYCSHLPRNSLVFPELRPDGDGKLGEKWGQWFSEYKRRVGITDRRVVFHSFRHAFIDMCRSANVPKRVHSQIVGHGDDDVSDSYGEGYPMHVIVAAVHACRLVGVNLPKPPG